MAKRTMIVMACFLLSAACLVVWERSSSAQVAPSIPGGALTGSQPILAGTECTVYLRGDAVGMSYRDRAVDLTSLVSFKGTIQPSGDQWVVLKSDQGKQQCMPVAAVAAIVADK